jgi:hypothetical protein
MLKTSNEFDRMVKENKNPVGSGKDVDDDFSKVNEKCTSNFLIVFCQNFLLRQLNATFFLLIPSSFSTLAAFTQTPITLRSPPATSHLGNVQT